MHLILKPDAPTTATWNRYQEVLTLYSELPARERKRLATLALCRKIALAVIIHVSGIYSLKHTGIQDILSGLHVIIQ